MPVYEVVMATGDWSIRLREETPITVRDAVSVPFGHLVVTGTHLPLSRFTGAQILEAAIYAGVCLRPGPSLELAGKGLPWHLDGGILETAVTNTDANITTWVSDIMTGDDATYPQPFSYFGTAAAGTLTTSFQYVTRRKAIDTVVRYYWGLEWKVRPTMELVVDSQTAIYGVTPTAIIAAQANGYESASGLWGLDGQAATALDYESYATRVLAVGQDQIGGAAITTPFYGPLGDPLGVGKLIDAPLATEASAVTTAGNILTPLTQPAYTVRLQADRYVISGRAVVGSNVWVYDPLAGFVDPATAIMFGGRTVHPRSVRLIGMRWPIQAGMGVFYRHHAIGTGVEKWIDLTPYVRWESGPAELEVGTRLRDLDGNDPSLASLSSPAVSSGAWTEYAPELGNITLGNGSVAGWYRRDGSTLFLNISLLWGSTSANSGSSNWHIGLPPGLSAASGDPNRTQHLTGMLYGPSGRTWRLVGELYGDDEWIYLAHVDGVTSYGGYVHDGDPVALVSGNQITLSGVVEVGIAVVERSAPVLYAFSGQTWTTGSAISPITPELFAGTLPITWSASGLPAGVTIDPSSGAITGTPPTASTGTATITATNGAGSDSETMSWTVADVAPTVAALPDTLWPLAYSAITPLTATVIAGTLPVTWSASGLPPGLSVNSSTGTISGTVTETYDNSTGWLVGGYAGTATITATNGAGSDSETIDWTLLATGELIITAYLDPDTSWSAVPTGEVRFIEKWQTSGDQRSFHAGYDSISGWLYVRFSESGNSVTRMAYPYTSMFANNSSSSAGYVRVVLAERSRPNGTEDVHGYWYESTDGSSWTAPPGATNEWIGAEDGFFRSSASVAAPTPTGYTASSVTVQLDGVQVYP
jgi:hypothetical protein